jgi:hypothetical protein
VITPPHSLQDSQASVNIQTTWSQSIQVCSSAPRAVIKEVQFQYNGSGVNPSLNSLTVMDVKTKQYSTNSQKPMWAVENPGPGWNISTIRLLWGIVNESYTQSEDLWIIQNDHLYLPAYVPDPLGGGSWGDSMVRAKLRRVILNSNLNISGIFQSSDGCTLADLQLGVLWHSWHHQQQLRVRRDTRLSHDAKVAQLDIIP